MRRHPDLFLLGAPKCGTTSLAAWLSEHPRIYMSPIKEPNYFNTDEAVRFRPSARRYAALFRKARPWHLAVGEASTRYLASRVALDGILRYVAHARFVVMVRNPVEMAPSLHEQNLFMGSEDVGDFRTAWRLQSERAAGRHLPSGRFEPGLCQYGYRCRLGEQVGRVRDLVGDARLHVVVLDDVRADARAAYRDILCFLEVPDDDRTEFPVLNPAKEVRSRTVRGLARLGWSIKVRLGINRSFGIADLNRRHRPRQPLDPAMRQELYAYFHRDICHLESLLGRSLPEWHVT